MTQTDPVTSVLQAGARVKWGSHGHVTASLSGNREHMNKLFTFRNGSQEVKCSVIRLPKSERSTRIIYRNDDTEYRTEIGGRQRSGQWPGQRSRDYYDDVGDEGYYSEEPQDSYSRRRRGRPLSRRRRRYRGPDFDDDEGYDSGGSGTQSSESRGSSASGYLHPTRETRRTTRSKKSTRRTPKLRRPKYNPARAEKFDLEQLTAWASKQEDPQTVTDMTDLARALATDIRRRNGTLSTNATAYGAHQLNRLFCQERPEEGGAGEANRLFSQIYTHAGLDGPSEAFLEDIQKSSPSLNIPAASLHGYLNSRAFYSGPAGRLNEQDLGQWYYSQPEVDRGRSAIQATKCSHVLANLLPQTQTQDETGIAALSAKIVKLGTRVANTPNVSLSALTGEVIGLMDESGYTAAECSSMGGKIPTLLAYLNDATATGVNLRQIHAVVSRELHSNKPVDFALNPSVPSATAFEGARRWLSDSRRSSASYDTESQDSYESGSSHGRSRDFTQYHDHRRSSRNRQSSPRQSRRTHRGSHDTEYRRSSGSGERRSKRVRFFDRSRSTPTGLYSSRDPRGHSRIREWVSRKFRGNSRGR